jgi:citrate lyase subunit gamma (acyl carrier protein)
MQIVKPAAAGTMESSDVYVEVGPGDQGLQLSLESVVSQQFGDSILQTVREVLEENMVENAVVRIVDRGALDCVIRARVETAILRGKGDA